MSAGSPTRAGAVSIPPAPPPREEWLYWLVFPGGAEWMDAAVRTTIAPAAALLQQHEAVGRWFFMRYLEQRGPHLRLRARVAPAAIDAVQRATDAILIDGLVRLEEHGARRRALLLDGASAGAASGSHRGLHRALYEPELEKFGGAAGVALAEQVFEASSRMALEAVRALPQPRRRARFVIALMRELEQLLPADTRIGLWTRYAEVWSGATKPGRHALLPRLTQAAERLRHDLATADATAGPDPPLVAAAASYRTVLACTLAEAAKHGIGDPLDLACQHMHLTDNRLGFTPIEEALIAPNARPGAPRWMT